MVKIHRIISITAEKAFDRVQHSFIIKTHIEFGREQNFFNLINGIYTKLTPHIIPNVESQNAYVEESIAGALN